MNANHKKAKHKNHVRGGYFGILQSAMVWRKNIFVANFDFK